MAPLESGSKSLEVDEIADPISLEKVKPCLKLAARMSDFGIKKIYLGFMI